MLLEPSIGSTSSRLQDLWSLGEPELAVSSAAPKARFQGEVGYGFSAWSGLVMPYSDFSITEGGSQAIGLGLRFSHWSSGLEMDLRVEQEGSATGATERSIGLEGRMEL